MSQQLKYNGAKRQKDQKVKIKQLCENRLRNNKEINIINQVEAPKSGGGFR